MNDPNALRPMTIEAALAALPGTSYDETVPKVSMLSPAHLMSAWCVHFRRIGLDLFLSGIERKYGHRSGVPVIAAESWRLGENRPRQTATGHILARAGWPTGYRAYTCEPAFEATTPENFITRITRITSQAGMGWSVRTTHTHLAATERTWIDASPSTVRLAGENAAPTTSGVADPGELSVGKDP